ncbi:hypothetical protein B7P43_G00493, partial [Cryptotermes secundus]
MEQSNDNDFQLSKPNSQSYPKTRNKLSSKHRVKLHCKKKCDSALYSPVSSYYRRNTSRFVAECVETVHCEQDSVEPNNDGSIKNCMIFELNKHNSITIEHCSSGEQNVNHIVCCNSEPTSQMHKKPSNINNTNKPSLQSKTIEIIQGTDAERTAAPTNDEPVKECRRESVDVTECGSGLTNSANDNDCSDKNVCVSLGQLNNFTTDSVSACVPEVYTSIAGVTRRKFHCPLCWKTSDKNEAQVLHIKACALRHSVTTRQLLDAVELQERQAAEREALGLPDIPAAHTVKKQSSKKSGQNGSDSNLQLALALSASLQEAEEREQLQEENCLLEAGLGHEVVVQQKQILERFGFRSSRSAIQVPSSLRHKSAKKSKNSNPLLLSRTKEERERLLTEKVALVLMGEENSTPSVAVNILHNTQDVNTTESLRKYQNKSCTLWNMGSVSCPENEFQSYYVKELTKFISPHRVPVGAKLKHLSQIPGWIKTPERKSHIMAAEEDTSSPVRRVTLSQMEASPSRDTETAKLRETKTRQSFVGPMTDRSIDNSLARTLINNWKSFLNKKAMSDIIIYVEKEMEIPAHKLVLYVRCKAVLQDVVSEVSSKANKETLDMLLWVDVSYKAALAFLQFLYCGLTSKLLHLHEEDLLSVKKLSERYRVSELLHYLKSVKSGKGQVNKSKDASLNLSPCHNASYCKKQSALHASCSSDTSASSQAASSPKKEIHSKDTFQFLNLAAELTKKSTNSGTKNEFHDSAESRPCSSGSLSPDLFIDDLEEPHVKPVSQEGRNSMDCLLSMLGKPSLSQNNAQNSSLLMSSDKLAQSNAQISSTLMSDKLKQSNSQINSALMSSDKLSQYNTKTKFTPMSSDKLALSDTQITSVLSPLDKLSLTMRGVGTSLTLQKNVTCINDDVCIPDDLQISSSSQSHDDKCVTSGKGMVHVENVDDIENKCDLLPSILVPDHTCMSDSVASCSPRKIKGQRNLLDENSENSPTLSESQVYSVCVPLQDSWEKTVKVDSDFDGIDFLEHLLSDSDPGTSSVYVQREIKQRMDTKRKHPEIDAVSDHCRSSVKRICQSSTKDEIIETFSDKTECNEESDKLMKSENEVRATLDMTQSSSSESAEPQELMLSSPVQKTVVDTNMATEHSSTHAMKECPEFTVFSDLFKKSKENSTSHANDNSRETTVEDNATTVKQKGENAEDDGCMKSDDNMQNLDDWDKFDEMCNASVPHIFSQCLPQLISTQTTSQKPLELSISSNKHTILRHSNRRSLCLSSSHPESQIQGSVTNHSSSCTGSPVRKGKNISENVKEPPSLSHGKRSHKVNAVLENSFLAPLSESVFWRDENARTPAESLSNHSKTVNHRTPVQNQTDVIFSDKVTPPADYTAMKTPQLKKELRKYGLKPSLTRRQAKRMLRYIYDQLHPYITVSDSEDDLEQSGAESSPFKKPGSDTQVPRSPVRKPNVLGTSRSPLMRSEDCCHRGNLVRQERSTAFQSGADSDSDDLLSSQRSSSSSAMSVREEAFFEELGVCSHGDIPLSQDVQPTPNLAAAVHSFITDDPNLHQKVLLYEPVLLEQLHANLKANNLKLKMNELMDYLDEQVWDQILHY